MTPDILIPKKARKIVLFVAGLISLALGAAPRAFAALHMASPDWFNATNDVYSFVVAAPLFLALVNINQDEAASLKPMSFDPATAPVSEAAESEVDEPVDEENAGLDVILAPKE